MDTRGLVNRIKDAARGLDSRAAKARAVAPIIIELYDQFVSTDADPMQLKALREEIIEACISIDLASRREVSPRALLVHPANRDNQGLLVIDVHDLLLAICIRGFAWRACEHEIDAMEPCSVGEHDDFVKFNLDLAERSAGLLAPVRPDDAEFFTTAGSHTTAAVRLYVLGARAVHQQLAVDGNISQSLILEKFPSMQKPMSHLKVNVFCKELCDACTIRPQHDPPIYKFAVLMSRAANAGHKAERPSTATQQMLRLHSVSLGAGLQATSEDIVRVAAVGDQNLIKGGSDLLEFIKAHAGARDPWLLTMVSEFEQTLSIKRVLRPKDMLALSKVSLPGSEIFIAAMLMAMVSSPSDYTEDDVSKLVGAPECASLAEGGVNRAHALAATGLMTSAAELVPSALTAAGMSTNDPKAQHLLNDMRIKLVMHVFQKRSKTRKAYNSMRDITCEFYQSLRCLVGEGHIPHWEHGYAQRKRSLTKAPAGPSEPAAKVHLRESAPTGSVPDSELARAGFNVNAIVQKKGGTKLWRITRISADHVFIVDAKPDNKNTAGTGGDEGAEGNVSQPIRRVGIKKKTIAPPTCDQRRCVRSEARKNQLCAPSTVRP